MNEPRNVFLGIISALALWLFGADITTLAWLLSLIFFMALDIVFGTIESKFDGTFKRQNLFKGFYKKILTLFLVAIAYRIDVIGVLESAINLERITLGCMIYYELLSVLHHIKIGGVSIPEQINTAISSIFKKFGGGTQP